MSDPVTLNNGGLFVPCPTCRIGTVPAPGSQYVDDGKCSSANCVDEHGPHAAHPHGPAPDPHGGGKTAAKVCGKPYGYEGETEHVPPLACQREPGHAGPCGGKPAETRGSVCPCPCHTSSGAVKHFVACCGPGSTHPDLLSPAPGPAPKPTPGPAPTVRCPACGAPPGEACKTVVGSNVHPAPHYERLIQPAAPPLPGERTEARERAHALLPGLGCDLLEDGKHMGACNAVTAELAQWQQRVAGLERELRDERSHNLNAAIASMDLERLTKERDEARQVYSANASEVVRLQAELERWKGHHTVDVGRLTRELTKAVELLREYIEALPSSPHSSWGKRSRAFLAEYDREREGGE